MDIDTQNRSEESPDPASRRARKDNGTAGTVTDMPEFELNGHPVTTDGEALAGRVALGERMDGAVLVARNAKHGTPVIGLKEGVVEGRAATVRAAREAEARGIRPKMDRGHPRITVTHRRFATPKEVESRPSEDAVADFVGDLETLIADFRAGRIEMDADLVARVPEGTYGVFKVLGGEDGDVLVSCPYGKQSPLKRLDAHFDYRHKAWRVDALKADDLNKALDRAAKREAKEREKAAEKAKAEAAERDRKRREEAREAANTRKEAYDRWKRDGLGFSPKRLRVTCDGGHIVLDFPYTSEGVAKVKTIPRAGFDKLAKNWRVPAERLDDVLAIAPEIDRLADEAENARAEADTERRREAERERVERGLKTRYRLSGSKRDTALGEIQWFDGWPYRVIDEKKEYNDEPTSILLPGIGFMVDPYWAIRMECEPLPEDKARPVIEKAEAEAAEKARREGLWTEFMRRQNDGSWTDCGDNRPGSRLDESGTPRPETARRISWSRDIGVVHALHVDEERGLLISGTAALGRNTGPRTCATATST